MKNLKKQIEDSIRSNEVPQAKDTKSFLSKQPVNKQLEKTIKYAFLLSKNYKSSVIKTEHFFIVYFERRK